jgi:hypothetical protein
MVNRFTAAKICFFWRELVHTYDKLHAAERPGDRLLQQTPFQTLF